MRSKTSLSVFELGGRGRGLTLCEMIQICSGAPTSRFCIGVDELKFGR